MFDDSKRIITLSVMGLSLTLLVFFLFFNSSTNDERDQIEDDSNNLVDNNSDDDGSNQTSFDSPKKDEVKVDEGITNVDKDDIPTGDDSIEEDVIEESPFSHIEVPTENAVMSDFYSERHITETREIAVNFVRLFHSYDKNNPVKHVEDIEKYVYSDVYDFFKTTKLQSVEGYFNIEGISERKVLTVAIIEPDVPFPYGIHWNVEVVADVIHNDGSLSEEVIVYNLEFEKNMVGGHKIGDFYITVIN